MIFGVVIWYVKLKHFAEAWSHTSRGPEVTLKRQYFFKTPYDHYFLSDFDETSAIRKRNTLAFSNVSSKTTYLLPFLCYFRFTKMTSKICLNVNNPGTNNDIDEQLVARSTESNSTHFIWRELFRKYFRYARMTSLKISKFGCKTQYNFRDVFRTGGGLTHRFVKFLFSYRKLKIIHQWRAY